jgi:hypothetical protein
MDFEDLKTGKFNYMTSVIGSEDLIVDMIYSTDDKNWVNVGKQQRYAGGSGWKKIVWSDLPPYYFYEIDIKPSSSLSSSPEGSEV